jgi:DedD protein
MTEHATESDNESGAGELRGQLVKRLAFAGVLVAVLLGVLAFFDYLVNPPDEAEQAVFTQPVPVTPKKEVSQPVKPAENLPEPPVPEKIEAPVEVPPAPVVEVQPSGSVEAETPHHQEARPAAGEKSAPVRTPKAAAQPPVAVVPEATMAPSNRLPPQPASMPAEPAQPKAVPRAVEPRPAAPVQPVPPPVVNRLFSGFLLQAGVFSSTQRAEELHAKLALSGVPSTLETRVQVGPFRSKQEAEAAQAKLKELGVETILIPPKGKY